MKKAFLLVALTFNGLAFGYVFNNPNWGGIPLDWCLYYANNCGKPAADRFCESQGFSSAATYSMRPNINYTRVIGESSRTCLTSRDGIRCDGFGFIDCQ